LLCDCCIGVVNLTFFLENKERKEGFVYVRKWWSIMSFSFSVSRVTCACAP